MRYTNKELLERTRNIHKATLWPSLRMALILNFAVGLVKSLRSWLSGIVVGENWASLDQLILDLSFSDQAKQGEILQSLKQNVPKLMVASVLSMLLGWLLFSFFDAIIREGYRRWFSRNRELTSTEGLRPTPSSRLLFSFFKQDTYQTTVKACFYKNFRLWLWGLPFYLLSEGVAYMNWQVLKQNLTLNYLFDNNPAQADIYYQTEWQDFGFLGFVLVTLFILSLVLYISKRLSYSQADWFLADNPQIGGQRALELSEKLMQGKKGALLLLAVSYLPWLLLPIILAPFLLILSVVLLPFLYLFVDSRYHQAQAEFYAAIRDEAVEKGLITMEELGYHRA